ncbi:MAG: hypothetical protein ABIT36_00020 [Steroidobacteraceae bacterium]
MARLNALSALLLATLAIAACSKSAKYTDQSAGPDLVRNQVERAEFNRLAVRLNLPFMWISDRNNDRNINADEVATLLFYPPYSGGIDAAYKEILAAKAAPALDPARPDDARRALVREDLDQGRATLVYNDLGALPASHKQFVQHMLKVATHIDALYARQTGVAMLAANLPADPESRSLFRRNRTPKCVAPATEKNPGCSALADKALPLADVYPPSIDNLSPLDPGFCGALHERDKEGDLSAPFSVIRSMHDRLEAVPYSRAYATEMAAVADELKLAAAALAGANEQPLVDYLLAAADSFRSNEWGPADEAWSRMNADNSRWYVRVGPDEVYWDPCSLKAGFHLTLALINQNSKQWQSKLAPIQQDMEAAVAKRAGPPYVARKVQFHLPDFIDIVINAGDDRDPIGATIGQSLPNVGDVAKESRGRTVVMVNLYTDPDSVAAGRASAASLLDAQSMKLHSSDPLPGLLNTILHEAMHNLGPAQEYAVKGNPVQELFGGQIDSTWEELKAETGALFLIDLLRDKGILSEELTRQINTYAVTWTFGHISQGMYTEPGHKPKAYSHLAAIMLGSLMDYGAVEWSPDVMAANGVDKGAFSIHIERMRGAADALIATVAGIKARGDRKAAEALIVKYVDGTVIPQAMIRERLARNPRASMVYSLTGFQKE